LPQWVWIAACAALLLLLAGAFTTLAVVSARGASKVTQSNFERIRLGMSEHEVIDILGPPGLQNYAPINAGNVPISPQASCKVLMWRRREGTITITLVRGRVLGRQAYNLP
jgi:hypothetical protein